MPEKGFASVTLPQEVLDEIRALVKDPDQGYESVADFVRRAISLRLAFERVDREMSEEWRREHARGPKWRLWKLLDVVDYSGLSPDKWQEAYLAVVEALMSTPSPRCPNCGTLVQKTGTRPRPSWLCPSCHWRCDLVAPPVRGPRTTTARLPPSAGEDPVRALDRAVEALPPQARFLEPMLLGLRETVKRLAASASIEAGPNRRTR